VLRRTRNCTLPLTNRPNTSVTIGKRSVSRKVCQGHASYQLIARNYAVAYFADHKIMSWGEPGKWLRIALMGEEFELRIKAVQIP
jgi:hypothetical protein